MELDLDHDLGNVHCSREAPGLWVAGANKERKAVCVLNLVGFKALSGTLSSSTWAVFTTEKIKPPHLHFPKPAADGAVEPGSWN